MMYPAFSNQGMFEMQQPMMPQSPSGISGVAQQLQSGMGSDYANSLLSALGLPSVSSLTPTQQPMVPNLPMMSPYINPYMNPYAGMFSPFIQQPMMPQQLVGGQDPNNQAGAVPYGGSQFGRDIGFGLMSLSNPIANFIGRAITGNEIDAIDRGFSNLPTTTGGDDSWLSRDGNENNGSNYSGPSDTYGGADAGTGTDDQWD